MRGWWRWALVSLDGVAPSWMVGVSASVNLPLHHKVQKFSSGTGSPGWSRKKGHKTVVMVVSSIARSEREPLGNDGACFYMRDALLSVNQQHQSTGGDARHWRRCQALEEMPGTGGDARHWPRRRKITDWLVSYLC